jgi:hypothetical protein
MSRKVAPPTVWATLKNAGIDTALRRSGSTGSEFPKAEPAGILADRPDRPAPGSMLTGSPLVRRVCHEGLVPAADDAQQDQHDDRDEEHSGDELRSDPLPEGDT